MNNITLKQLNELFGNDNVRVVKDDDGAVYITVWNPDIRQRLYLDIVPNTKADGNADILINVDLFGDGPIRKFSWSQENENE